MHADMKRRIPERLGGFHPRVESRGRDIVNVQRLQEMAAKPSVSTKELEVAQAFVSKLQTASRRGWANVVKHDQDWMQQPMSEKQRSDHSRLLTESAIRLERHLEDAERFAGEITSKAKKQGWLRTKLARIDEASCVSFAVLSVEDTYLSALSESEDALRNSERQNHKPGEWTW